MKRIFFIAVIAVAAVAPPARGQMKHGQASPGGDAEQDLRKMLDRWDEAYARRDAEAVARILADGFIYTDASGRVLDKMQYISACFKAPEMTLAGATASEDVRVHLYGETAVMNSRGRHRGQPLNRDPAARYRYTDIWVLRQGRWQAVSSQATPILQP